MGRLIYGLAVILMIIWTIFVMADLAEVVAAAPWLVSPQEPEPLLGTALRYYEGIRAEIWGASGQARAIVWGLPMMVFGLIAALTQPVARPR